jgi:aminopeptidase N
MARRGTARRLITLALLVLLAACSADAHAPATPAAIAPAATARPAPTAAPATPVPSATAVATPAPPTATLPATATPDPNAPFAVALRPEFAGDLAATAGLPRYDLKLRVDPANRALAGVEQIVVPNRTGAPLDDVGLRLYPNFPRDVFGKGGDVRMDITGAAVDGRPVEARYAAQRTAALIPLAPPLEPGQSATLAITFTATIAPWRDGTWPLPSYYPLLAARDRDGWRLDVTRFADRVYAESALYEAEISVPEGMQVVASGSTSAARAEADGGATYVVAGGPIREFALTVGDFVGAQAAAGDVAVNVYMARGSRLDAAEVARVAAAALADFDRRFGAYPYRELDIQLLPYEFDGGDEYPGLILLYAGGAVGAGTRYVAAHEVAHQWWYGVVGNDIYRQPWLDEAFAQYSGIIYAEDVAGAAVAARDWEREVLRRYRGAQADGDLPVGLAIDDYPGFNVYYRTIYGKGPVFLRALRDELGDEVFFRALQTYYARHRYGVATTADVRRAFEDAGGRDLGALFEQWVGGRR